MRRVRERGSLDRLVSVKDINAVLGPHRVGDYEDPPILSTGVGNKTLDDLFTFFDRSGQPAFI